MKLIVDISDEAYELCKRGTTGTFLINSGMRSGKTFLMSLYKSITNGCLNPIREFLKIMSKYKAESENA